MTICATIWFKEKKVKENFNIRSDIFFFYIPQWMSLCIKLFICSFTFLFYFYIVWYENNINKKILQTFFQAFILVTTTRKLFAT